MKSGASHTTHVTSYSLVSKLSRKVILKRKAPTRPAIGTSQYHNETWCIKCIPQHNTKSLKSLYFMSVELAGTDVQLIVNNALEDISAPNRNCIFDKS